MASAILNHHITASQAITGTTPTPAAAAANGSNASANAASTSSSTSSDSATISANDFLTLLVTEMKNQDPTADTDPNEYINQLVNVNSLEQLIQINQTLTTDSGSTTAGSSGAATTGSSRASSSSGAATTGTSTPVQPASSGTATNLPGALSAAANKLAPGNLSIPAANPAAQSVAQSLSGRPHK
ncbi:MAG: flagellar hook capping FlgD N-terminal domain-containing protein [Terracidiphilus sp.]|jgi:flagellar basal-body rod modification protein FlgD